MANLMLRLCVHDFANFSGVSIIALLRRRVQVGHGKIGSLLSLAEGKLCIISSAIRF